MGERAQRRRALRFGGVLLAATTLATACGGEGGRNTAVSPSRVQSISPSKLSNGEYPSGFVSGPATSVAPSAVPSEQKIQALLLHGQDVEKNWTAVNAGALIGSCDGTLPSGASAAASGQVVYYAPGISTPVFVEEMSSYSSSAASSAFHASVTQLTHCGTVTIEARTSRLSGPVKPTGSIVSNASSQSFEAKLNASTLHAGMAVIHEGTVVITLVYLTSSAPDPQTLKTYSDRALAKVRTQGV